MPTPSAAVVSDADLVAASLAGDREAFGWIVERYQRLLCSLAYSATGQLAQSEDIAQETFVEAWRQLKTLRDPESLRGWLCGILRFKVSRLRRSDDREPVRQADSLELADEIESADAPAPELTIRKEEEAILWSALERVPDVYRDALILYYREHRSIEHVAAALDVSEDAVKQRLSRGRVILQEQVLAFVEGALERSSPGRLFTAGVLAALPELARPVHVAAIGAAAKGSALAKSTLIATLLASFSGVISGALVLRSNLDQSRTTKERRYVVKVTLLAFVGAFGWLGVLYALRAAGLNDWMRSGLAAALAQTVTIGGMIGWCVMLLRSMRQGRELRLAERRAHPELFNTADDRAGNPASEYRSRWSLLGVPLFHARLATPDPGTPPVVAWFAVGDRAYGLIGAWGALAVAPISMGAISIGIVTVGSLAVGGLAIGTAALGYIAGGGAAVGARTFAWLSAMGSQSAQSGGFAIAGNLAQGPMAWAPHANDTFAATMLANPHGQQNMLILLYAAALSAIVPAALFARAVRKRLRRERATGI